MMKQLLVAICGLPLAFALQMQAGEADEPTLGGTVDVAAAEEGVLHRDNPVERARQALADGDPEDPLLRSQLAHSYLAMNRDEDALREYLWCWEELKKHDAPQYLTEGAKVFASLMLLAQRAPGAAV